MSQAKQAKIALLPDRGAVSVDGPDAAKLLQGLITNDLGLLEHQPAIHAALLSPQGKILFDFFVARAHRGYLLECRQGMADGLAKRLTLYRLRAAAEIKNVSDAYVVVALWGDDHRSSGETAGTVSFADPRLPALGRRILTKAPFARDIAAATIGSEASVDDYDAHRIGLGVPEGGKDFAFGDAFPHEAMMDLLHGVSFTKGCYVGQEIVSRMQHRGTARKRIVPVDGAAPLASGAEVVAGDVAIGSLGSVAGTRGLAMIRLDRAAEFEAQGIGLTAGGVPVAIDLPEWAKLALGTAATGSPQV